MFSKIIFVLATVYVVNASVISANVFDDDPETEVASNPKRCTFQACDQRCRRLKFPGGVCVNGRCKCDNLLNAQDEISENTLSDLEDLGSLKEVDPDTEVASNPKGCNFRACHQRCRRLKFPGGTYVNGRCKCDNFLNAEDEVSEKTLSDLEDSGLQTDDFEAEVAAIPSRCYIKVCDLVCRWRNKTSSACINGRCKCDNKSIIAEDGTGTEMENKKSDCSNQACDQLCRRLKFPGGACVSDRCKCDNFLNTEVTESNAEDSVPSRACNNNRCNQLCRKKKFRGGACLGANCYCNKFISLLEEDQTERGCIMQACDQLCRRLNFPGDTCVNGRCKCDNSFGTEDAVDEYSEFAPTRVCRLTKCNRTCTRRGYEGATCVNGRCMCYNKTQAEDEIPETSQPVSELSGDKTERGCNMRACEQSCRRLKFSGGACVNARCKCDNFFGTEYSVDEYSELDTRRICNLRQCNRTCTRRGYEGARCVNGLCKCYNKIQRQDTSPLNDVTIDENEESTVILWTNEEELIVPSPKACNTLNCNPMCRRLNYAGGWCRLGQCKCYKRN